MKKHVANIAKRCLFGRKDQLNIVGMNSKYIDTISELLLTCRSMKMFLLCVGPRMLVLKLLKSYRKKQLSHRDIFHLNQESIFNKSTVIHYLREIFQSSSANDIKF